MNKKILAGLVLGVLILAGVQLVFAQTGGPGQPTGCIMRGDLSRLEITGCPAVNSECPYNSTDKNCAVCCLLGSVIMITDWIFLGLVAITVIFVLLGAFNILTAAGDTNKITTGKNYILWAAIGFACALLARSVPQIVRYFVG